MSEETQDRLIIDKICKTFGQHKVLDEISFTVRDGEFLSILGPSGCGKTTILRSLIGLETLDSGRILNCGRDITNASPSQRGMGIVFQNYALFENMTVLENVAYALKCRPERRKDAEDTALSVLESVGMTAHKDKRPVNLSGGQQQRVAIARTLALSPEIILFDEPMSALDVDARLALRLELKELQRKYRSTYIYITHDQEEAFAMSDRIMVMDNGRIAQIDTPTNLIDHPADVYVERFVKYNINLKIESLLPFWRNA